MSGDRSRWVSRSNSVAVSASSWELPSGSVTRALRRAGSTRTGPRTSAVAGTPWVRRRTAWTRATSSRGLNGFVT